MLWSLYPRYEISHEHINQTLSELEMFPSAVIFVVTPGTSGTGAEKQVPTKIDIMSLGTPYLVMIPCKV